MSESTGSQTQLDLAREMLTLMLGEQIPEVEARPVRFKADPETLDHDAIEMDAGADVFSITVDREGLTLHGRRKMGSGREPYADDPTTHKRLLDHPALVDTEGTVVYPGREGKRSPLHLPKILYFDERRAFGDYANTPPCVDEPQDFAEAVSAVLGIELITERVSN